MVGPELAGKGGISQVVKVWEDASFFTDVNFMYIASISDRRNKILTFLVALARFIGHLLTTGPGVIVYIHSAAYSSFYRKSLFIVTAKLFGKRVILHIHPSCYIDFHRGLAGVRKKYTSGVLNMVDAIVVLNEGMYRFITDLYPDKQIHVLPNAVNVAEMNNSWGIKRESARLLFLGWYIKEKGVYDLVDAVALLRGRGVDLKLDFYGTKGIEKLRAYVEQKRLATAVHVNGWIDGQEKINAFYASTMLVLPSHTEGMPNVILEAMATRTPIVATAAGGLKEMLTDGENAVIVAMNDPNDLADKIERLMTDAHQRDAIAETAYREVLQHYDVEVIRDQFWQLLMNLAP